MRIAVADVAEWVGYRHNFASVHYLALLAHKLVSPHQFVACSAR